MARIWNTAMRGTPIPQVNLTPPRRRSARRIFREACRGKMVVWQMTCDLIAGSPRFRGERNGSGFENWRATWDWLMAGDRCLNLIEEKMAERDAYNADLRRQGIEPNNGVWSERFQAWMPKQPDGTPSTPEEADEQMKTLFGNQKKLTSAGLDATKLPTLTRRQILAINPRADAILGPPNPHPELEAQLCAVAVKWLRAAGELPEHLGGGEALVNVRS